MDALLNKRILPIHEKFLNNGWHLKENSEESTIYIDPINENDKFCIKINANNIDVSVPIPNSNIQYNTTLKDYFSTCEYLEMHLNNFMEKENRFVKEI